MLQDISVNEILLLALAQSASGAVAGLLAGNSGALFKNFEREPGMIYQ